MKNKILNFIIIFGICLFLAGFYSAFIKAGLPYPDPTPELTRKWEFYNKYGIIFMRVGKVTFIFGIILKLIYWINKRFLRN